MESEGRGWERVGVGGLIPYIYIVVVFWYSEGGRNIVLSMQAAEKNVSKFEKQN